MAMIRLTALGGILFRRGDRGGWAYTAEDHALMNARGAEVLRTGTCPDCHGPLVTMRGFDRPVADDGWHSYRCKDLACWRKDEASSTGWSYHFWPGAKRLVLSGAPIPMETEPRTGRYKLHAAVEEMLETGACCLCGERHLHVTHGRGLLQPDEPNEPTVFTCESPDCGMVWKTGAEHILGTVRQLRRRLDAARDALVDANSSASP